MAKIFLDTNWLIDILIRDRSKAKQLTNFQTFTSPLSYHILCYTHKAKLPEVKIKKSLRDIEIVGLTRKVLDIALEGPTKDLEDNIQLHSAAEAECDYFLTNDKDLLKMKFFGKTKVVNKLES
ncbi:type II toxin-antitoxin system VapC family toxin [Patescibacteria group bacterium]|nr:type II toxin-antitoxin system VapC family toxin [Patescibacteria group bacterium]